MMHRAAVYARSRGFATRNIDYPLCDLHAALKDSKSAARDASTNRNEVYAYGESAGGDLAAILAQKGLTKSAATYSAVPDIQEFMNNDTGGLGTRLNASQADLRAASPVFHLSDQPILALAATDDQLTPSDDTVEWARWDEPVHYRLVTGGHVGAGPIGGEDQGSEYVTHMREAIDWLGARAGLLPTSRKPARRQSTPATRRRPGAP